MTGRSPASEWLQQFLTSFLPPHPRSNQAPAQHSSTFYTSTSPAWPQTHAFSPGIDPDPLGSPQQTSLQHGLQQQQQQQSQKAQARLGRGQLFHCWRRKPDEFLGIDADESVSPAAPAASANSASATTGTQPGVAGRLEWGSDGRRKLRRASFHAGQNTQPSLSEPIPLHGPGRPSSSRPRSRPVKWQDDDKSSSTPLEISRQAVAGQAASSATSYSNIGQQSLQAPSFKDSPEHGHVLPGFVEPVQSHQLQGGWCFS